MGNIIVKIIYGSVTTPSHLKPRKDTYKIIADDLNVSGVFRENESVVSVGEDFDPEVVYDLMTDIVFKELRVYFNFDVEQEFHEKIYTLINRYLQESAPQLISLWPYPRYEQPTASINK